MRILFLVFFSVSISSCVRAGDKNEQPALKAARISLLHAEQDGVDLSLYSIQSIRRGMYGKQSVVAPSETSPHIEGVREKLKEKVYWETCYGPSSLHLVGATYCYYLDDVSFDLLTTYRSK